MQFVADFETTTDETDCRVWAAAWVNIDSVNLPNYGNTLRIENSLEKFLDYFKMLEGVHDCYFHNLKFDGEFILSYLLRNGYTYSDSRQPKTFETLISDTLDGSVWIFQHQNPQERRLVTRSADSQACFL